jgi:hypothetical protein
MAEFKGQTVMLTFDKELLFWHDCAQALAQSLVLGDIRRANMLIKVVNELAARLGADKLNMLILQSVEASKNFPDYTSLPKLLGVDNLVDMSADPFEVTIPPLDRDVRRN